MAKRQKDSEFFLENEEDDDIEDTKIDNGGGTSSNEDVGKGGEESSQRSRLPSSPFSSQQWPQSSKETTDSYTIAASPIFGALRRTSGVRYSGYEIGTRSSLDLDTEAPLLCEYEKIYEKEVMDRISRSQS